MRTISFSPSHHTLVIEEASRRKTYRMHSPSDVLSLFKKLRFPEAHTAQGINVRDDPDGPCAIFYRVYPQLMPGQLKPHPLVWCCELVPNQDVSGPNTLTPAEARKRYGIDVKGG